MNLPNKLTLCRVFAIPLFLIFMLVPGIPHFTARLISLLIFILACVTDALDGYIARRDHLVTDFGKFMDPLADKLLVSSALICFVQWKTVPAIIVIIIIGREFIISGFRLVAADNRVVIAASMWGKVKTVVQMFFCMFFIADFNNVFFNVLEQVLMYASAVLSIISLIDYIRKNKGIVSSSK